MKAFVTGGAGGIGKSIVSLFENNEIEVVAPTIEELDITNTSETEKYVRRYGDFDILINCAGINNLASIDEMTEDALMTTLRVNLTSQAMLIKMLSPAMKAKKYGRIVNFASIWCDFSKVRRIMYSVSKAGGKGLTTAAAVELSQYNVLVNAVAPGFVATEMTYKNNNAAQIKAFEDALPIKRMAKPEEIAEFVYFLASPKNSFITGQTIFIAGGFSCI